MVPLSGHKGSTQKFGIALSWERAFQTLLTAIISLCWRPVELGCWKKCPEREQGPAMCLKSCPGLPLGPSPVSPAGTQDGICSLGFCMQCLVIGVKHTFIWILDLPSEAV